jgi:hypothetical protein
MFVDMSVYEQNITLNGHSEQQMSEAFYVFENKIIENQIN